MSQRNCLNSRSIRTLIGAVTLFVGGMAMAMPNASTPISPNNNVNITDTTPTYTFSEVMDSTWYYLWVADSSGVKIRQWYRAAQAGCGGGTCSVTPATEVAPGAVRWWIQTWNNQGYGPWSTAGTFSVGAAPAAATLISPMGAINTNMPAYNWNAVAGSSWYYIWVQDSSGVKIRQWYTAAQAGCGAGTGTCSVTPNTQLANGNAAFWIRTWNSIGIGPWSTAGNFNVSAGGDPNLVMCNVATDAQVQAALHAAINLVRSTPTVCNGVTMPAVPALTLNTPLANSTQNHSNDMANNNYFDHTGQNGSTFSSRAQAAGYTGVATGENIAAGSQSVGATVQQWVNSTSGHCEGLMTANSNEMGAACAYNANSDWTYYWTFVSGIAQTATPENAPSSTLDIQAPTQ